ncbi:MULTISPECIES: alpha/beta hydrolase [Salegentibacter]|jgi:phospholipase/carboxylesterase|uniref:Phospholipase/carboxylesterase n=1 Tax=Salegentibacter agarivorans TaxID=345907 RepID=A0A1I2NAL0_9FLAO|nr:MULTISPECIES: alpha/beta fold hydrolase [Salegentibacter]APS39769.1 phospholipase [Salegentibacter sp. T436]SFF98546.1 phospholipase/carboxylesterase [Salegentibacter agarivorans]
MNTKELSLHHLIRKPKTQTEKTPLLIMLHGYGSDENDLFSFAEELPDELFVISVKAPHAMQPYGNAWYAIHWDNQNGKFSDDEQAKESREKITGFIDEAIEAYNLDAENVTLLGFSQGSILSYAVALSYPEKVKNIVALSGYINKEIIKPGFEKNDFSKLSFYCSHGSQDQVIPVEWARKTKPVLDKLNIENSYSEFPVGHGVAPQNFFELREWLKKRI